ncbi:MAG: VWA domain-containing protein [Thermomicrobiales bacterium]
MAADAAPYDRFDAFLDDLALDLPATGHGIEPRLSSTARTIFTAAAARKPEPAFARQLRRSLLRQPVTTISGDSHITSDPPHSHRPSRLFAFGRRGRLTEPAAIAAVVLLLILGLGATGQLSLPDWIGGEEPSHLAAPHVPTEGHTATPGVTTRSGDLFAQASGSSGAETDDPFPVGSTVVVTADLVNFRSEPDIDYENIIEVLHLGAELVVWSSVFEEGGHTWLPVQDEESGVAGYVMVDFVEASPATVVSGALAASPEPGSAAILFIVDTSGSMSYDPLGQTSKLEWEKETVRRALNELPVGDQIGVLAFNDRYTVAVPMTRIEREADRDAVASSIDAIAADGGSELEPALRAGLDMLNRTNAATKHAVLLTDGKSRDDVPSELQRIVQAAHADGIVLSVIALGNDADTAILQFLAETGGGRHHHITSPDDIPTIHGDGSWSTATPAATPAASSVSPLHPSPVRTVQT